MPGKRIIKVIIDTNLWISFLIGKKLSILKELIVENTVSLIICEQLLTEIKEVTSRPKINKYFPKTKVAFSLALEPNRTPLALGATI